MNATISSGTILIREEALLPRSMQVKGQRFSRDWTRVAPEDRAAFERQISDAGWTFFYLAGKITATAFGQDEKAVRRTVKRLLAGKETQQFNCMEIMSSGDEISRHAFCDADRARQAHTTIQHAARTEMAG